MPGLRLTHGHELRTLRAELAKLLAHTVELRCIEQRSDLHPMQRSAAAVFRNDERIHKTVRLESVDELDRVVAGRELARLRE
jgi:hypothetical protein